MGKLTHLRTSFINLILMCIFLLPVVSFGAVIHVPEDYSTIQAAIDAAGEGDEIIVSPGTYYENINFKGKNIILRSTEPENPSVVASTIIDGNQAGPVVIFAGSESAHCVLSGFTITNGKASRGGGIYADGALATIQYNVIKLNTATSYGGGIYRNNGIIQNNTISGNSTGYGGGLCWCDGTIQNNTISGNSAFAGGGLYSCDGTIQNNTISGNSADWNGGGLASCRGTIQNNTISGNSADRDGGGLSQCSGTIQNNTISGNSADWGGGLSQCSGPIQNNAISGNWANYGGGLYECGGTIQNNTISGNSADERGGGLSECQGTIQNNTISGNSADRDGGGLYFCDGVIQNNIISRNSADWGGGLSDCDGTIQNNTIWHNTATLSGGGLYGCDGTIRNCIIWANITGISGPSLYASATPEYSCIQYWSGGGTGNISLNPQLVDPENGDFHLQANSPCIDAGCFISDLNKDFEGDDRGYDGSSEPRGDGSDYDIGADEYVPTPTPVVHYTFDTGAEGWQFGGEISPLDVPTTVIEPGHIGLSAQGSTNCFSYWGSPDIEVENVKIYGKIYRSHWRVSSDAPTTDSAVQFRLRVNQKGAWSAWDRVVNSYLAQAPFTGNIKDYYVFFDPRVTGVEDNKVVFSFDILSFDANDDTNSWLYLEELMVEEVSVTPGIEVISYDFTSGSDGWVFEGPISGFDAPLSEVSPERIGLNPNGSVNCFSYWYSPDVQLVRSREQGAKINYQSLALDSQTPIYRVKWEVESSVTNPDDAVQFRVRANQRGTWSAWNRIVNSYLQNAPSSGNLKTYDVILNPVVTGVNDDDRIILSFDILSFDANDDETSWVYLHSVRVEEISINP